MQNSKEDEYVDLDDLYPPDEPQVERRHWFVYLVSGPLYLVGGLVGLFLGLMGLGCMIAGALEVLSILIALAVGLQQLIGGFVFLLECLLRWEWL